MRVLAKTKQAFLCPVIRDLDMKNSIDPKQVTRYRVLKPLQERIGYVVLNLLMASLLFIPFSALWGANVLWQALSTGFHWVLLAFFASIYVHEALHVLGFIVFAGVSRDSTCIKMDWKNLDIQTQCGAPMTAGAYRWSALLPAIVLGVIPAFVSLIYGYGWLAIWSMLALNGATSDFLNVWVIHDFKNSDMVAMVIAPSDHNAVKNEDNAASV